MVDAMQTFPSNAVVSVIIPRVSETDACGHINNTTLPIWFEAGRRSIFQAITPSMLFSEWKLALVFMRVDFLNQTYFNADVTIATWVSKIGTKSITIKEMALQRGIVCAVGECAYVYYDFQKQSAFPVPAEVRNRLTNFLSLEKK